MVCTPGSSYCGSRSLACPGDMLSSCRFVPHLKPVSFRISSFQVPILILSCVLVVWKVNIKLSDEIQNGNLSDKLRRIDVLGSLTMAGAVGCLFLGFDLKTTDMMEWTHPLVVLLLISSALFAFAFLMVEEHWAPFPVMPLRLITQRLPLCIALSNLLLSMGVYSMVCCPSIQNIHLTHGLAAV